MMNSFKTAFFIIKKKGWAKGYNRGPQGEYCLLSAIQEAVGPKELFYDYVDVLMKHIGYTPDRWQDHPDRTKQDVLNLLLQMDKEYSV